MTTFIFVRHGTNDWVKKNRLPGWTKGIHLNAEGHQQAEAVAERLKDLKLAAVYASHLERAIETAEHIAKRHKKNVVIRENLADLKTGDWTGRSVKQAARSKLWQDVQMRPSHTRMPGGESFSEMQGRLIGELKAISETHPKGNVVVVSHADAIKSIVAYYLRLNLDDFQRIIISPASITVIHLEKHGARLLRLNDAGGPLVPPPPKKTDAQPKNRKGVTAHARRPKR